jgi:hypothetical protein
MLADALSLLFPETSVWDEQEEKKLMIIIKILATFEKNGRRELKAKREEIMFCFYLIHTPNLHNT